MHYVSNSSENKCVYVWRSYLCICGERERVRENTVNVNIWKISVKLLEFFALILQVFCKCKSTSK